MGRSLLAGMGSSDAVPTLNAFSGDDVRSAGSHALCCVCFRQFHKYTCPNCRARYCSLPCYKKHGEACTETFYRKNAVGELQSKFATKEEQEKMREILERMYQVEITGDDASSDEDDSPHESCIPGVGPETLELLIQKGEDADLSHLNDQEAAALRELVAHADLASLVQPWKPWWLQADARSITLTPSGTRLVKPLAADSPPPRTTRALRDAGRHCHDDNDRTCIGSDSSCVPATCARQTPSSGPTIAEATDNREALGRDMRAAGSIDTASSDSSSAIDTEEGECEVPAPPQAPLPPLAALSTSPPSPLLHFQALELLFAYCFAMRLYNGEPSCDWISYAACVWHMTPSLFEPPTAAPPPHSSAQALISALERACQPPIGDATFRAAAKGVMHDVRVLLQCGRGAMLCTLCDLQRHIEASHRTLSRVRSLKPNAKEEVPATGPSQHSTPAPHH